MSDGRRPLEGIRVLELASIVAGPFYGALMAEFGAEVIKTELPGKGDDLRRYHINLLLTKSRIPSTIACATNNRLVLTCLISSYTCRKRDGVEHHGKRALKILHTADVHLDCDSSGKAEQRQAHRDLYYRCFQTIVERAMAAQVDVLLIAGDLFDHNRVPDDTIAFAQEQLRRLQRPVVILPGNHDCLYTNAIYDRYDFHAACNNVRVITELDGQVIEFPELDLVLWGRAMEEHTPSFQPLAHIPTRHDQRWHIALAHGFFYQTRQQPDRSSPIFAEEIRDTGWDYVALGHQHVLTDVSQGSVTAYYSGAPLVHWTGETPNGHVLLLDLSPEHGIRVQRERVF